MQHSIVSATADVAALTAIDHPEPTSAIRMPLTAGPISPPKWNVIALRLIALRSRSVPTTSEMKAERDGASMAAATPVNAATA